MVETVSIPSSDFVLSSELGADISVVLVVKAIDHCGGQDIGSCYGRQNYSEGMIMKLFLECGKLHLDSESGDFFSDYEPCSACYDHKHERLALSCGNKVMVLGPGDIMHCYRYQYFAHLHTICFSQDGQRFLVASSGFDAVFEVHMAKARVLWEWWAWDHGYDYNHITGHHVCRNLAEALSYKSRHIPFVLVQDADAWQPFGLPTLLRPAHVNGARYIDQEERKIVITMARQGKAVMVDRLSGETVEILKGLPLLHGLQPLDSGRFVVCSTQDGRCLLLNENFAPTRILKFHSLPLEEDRCQHLEGCSPIAAATTNCSWLQNVQPLQDGVLGALDMTSSVIWLLDLAGRRYRTLHIPKSWAVQEIVAVPRSLSIRNVCHWQRHIHWCEYCAHPSVATLSISPLPPLTAEAARALFARFTISELQKMCSVSRSARFMAMNTRFAQIHSLIKDAALARLWCDRFTWHSSVAEHMAFSAIAVLLRSCGFRNTLQLRNVSCNPASGRHMVEMAHFAQIALLVSEITPDSIAL